MKRSSSLFLLLFFGGCVSPTYGPTDDKAIEPSRDKYRSCIVKETQATIDGSDDVGLLVNHILATCDPQLKPVETYLKGRGFGTYQIQAFLNDMRREANGVTTSVILRAKAGRTP